MEILIYFYNFSKYCYFINYNHINIFKKFIINYNLIIRYILNAFSHFSIFCNIYNKILYDIIL